MSKVVNFSQVLEERRLFDEECCLFPQFKQELLRKAVLDKSDKNKIDEILLDFLFLFEHANCIDIVFSPKKSHAIPAAPHYRQLSNHFKKHNFQDLTPTDIILLFNKHLSFINFEVKNDAPKAFLMCVTAAKTNAEIIKKWQQNDPSFGVAGLKLVVGSPDIMASNGDFNAQSLSRAVGIFATQQSDTTCRQNIAKSIGEIYGKGSMARILDIMKQIDNAKNANLSHPKV